MLLVMNITSPPLFMKKKSLNSLREKNNGFIVASLVAILLTSCFVSFFYLNSKVLQEISLLTLIIPTIIQIKQKNVDWSSAKKAFFLTTPYLLSLIMALFINLNGDEDSEFAAILVANLTFSFSVFSIIGSRKDRDVWHDVMKVIPFLTIPIFIFVLISQRNAYLMGRWEPYYTGDVTGAHPNWWGLMALGLGWCALAWKNILIRFSGLAIAVYYMYLLQSRGALVALVVAFIFCSGYFFPVRPKRIFLLFILFLLGTVLIAMTGDGLLDFIANHVLLLNDPERGAGTGMSGRTAGYATAWKAINNAPFLGNGLGVFGFVHNGFLLILAEGGIVTLLSTLFLFATSIRKYKAIKHWSGLGYVLSYIVLLLTYPRLFNTNMTSLLAMMVITQGLSYGKQPRDLPSNAYNLAITNETK